MLIGAAILVAFGFSLWQLQQERLWPEENRKMAQDYKDVQLWASEHTDPQALFLPEPVTFYAWRGYANRSSAGNLREWISVGWYYNSNYDSYIEGQKRYEEFGFQTKNYFGRSPPIQGFIDLTNDFEKKFYSLSDNDFLNFAGKYKIDYMVLRKPKLGRKTELPVAYENENYLLVKTASTKAEK